MTVLAKSKNSVNKIRRHRDGRNGRPTGRGGAPEARVNPDQTPGAQRRREVGGMQDLAVYTCECGFVFHAPVSTTVGCPHCGGSQAW
ncbi:MAG: hypothetical protein ACJ780_08550 [Solirubrobacteraceae bacterium]